MKKPKWTATWMAALTCCVIGARGAQAQVRLLHVVAVDKAGQPVTDLKASDLRLVDDGQPQAIVSLQLNDARTGAAAQPHITIILFDLLNNNFSDANYVASTIVRALEKAEDPVSIYLYIFTARGTLVAVRGLPPAGAPATGVDWKLNAKALIGNAVNQVFGAGPVNGHLEGNFGALTFQTLHNMASALAWFPGRKSIVWSTRGFPAVLQLGSDCRDYVSEDIKPACKGRAFDFTPVVWQVGAEMDQAGLTLYAVDESNSIAAAPERSMLEVLTGATGGKVFGRGQAPGALEDASAEMRVYYTLSYQPAGKSWDGKFHKVTLTCARNDVRVRAEDGYLANVPAPHRK